MGREDLRDEGCCERRGCIGVTPSPLAKQCFPHTELEEVLCESVFGGTKPFWDGNSEGQVSSEKASPLTLGRKERVHGKDGSWESSEDEREIYLLRANSIYDDF